MRGSSLHERLDIGLHLRDGLMTAGPVVRQHFDDDEIDAQLLDVLEAQEPARWRGSVGSRLAADRRGIDRDTGAGKAAYQPAVPLNEVGPALPQVVAGPVSYRVREQEAGRLKRPAVDRRFDR